MFALIVGEKSRHQVMTPLCTLLVQPYGGAIIDDRAKVSFLNETATDIALALVNGCDKTQAAGRIADTYRISKARAYSDIAEFFQY